MVCVPCILSTCWLGPGCFVCSPAGLRPSDQKPTWTQSKQMKSSLNFLKQIIFFFSGDGNRRREWHSFQEGVTLCGALSRSQSVVSFDHHMVQFPLLADMGSFTSLCNYQKNKDGIGKYWYSWNISLSLEVYPWDKLIPKFLCFIFWHNEGENQLVHYKCLLKAESCLVCRKEANWKVAEIYMFSINKYTTFGQSTIWFNTFTQVLSSTKPLPTSIWLFCWLFSTTATYFSSNLTFKLAI